MALGFRAGSFAFVDNSTVVINGVKKWENENDTAEVWTAQKTHLRIRTAIGDSSVTWTDESDTPETWTSIAANSKSWQTRCNEVKNGKIIHSRNND